MQLFSSMVSPISQIIQISSDVKEWQFLCVLAGEIAHFGAGYDSNLTLSWMHYWVEYLFDLHCISYRVFLLIQLVSVISFITWLNDCCLSEKYAERWYVFYPIARWFFSANWLLSNNRCYSIYSHIHLMISATAAYVLCLAGIIMLYLWYAPETSCLINIFFITWTLVILQLMTSVSLKVSSWSSL